MALRARAVPQYALTSVSDIAMAVLISVSGNNSD
jgi:hypothetical protein